jgi:hypothetical protein
MFEQQTNTLPLKATYIFGVEKGLGREIDNIKDMEIEWDRPYMSSLRRGYVVKLFEDRGLFEEFKALLVCRQHPQRREITASVSPHQRAVWWLAKGWWWCNGRWSGRS